MMMAMIMIMMFIPVEQHDKLKDPWLLELFLVGLRRLERDPEMFDLIINTIIVRAPGIIRLTTVSYL